MSQITVQVIPKGATAGDLAPASISTEPFLNRAEEIGQSLGEIAKRLRAKIDAALGQESETGTRWKLDGVQLKFSFDLESQVGLVVARGSAKAGFEASLTWKSSV